MEDQGKALFWACRSTSRRKVACQRHDNEQLQRRVPGYVRRMDRRQDQEVSRRGRQVSKSRLLWAAGELHSGWLRSQAPQGGVAASEAPIRQFSSRIRASRCTMAQTPCMIQNSDRYSIRAHGVLHGGGIVVQNSTNSEDGFRLAKGASQPDRDLAISSPQGFSRLGHNLQACRANSWR